MKLETITASETVGELIARYLAEIGVTTVFGVISIHNMPILDAIARQGRIRFVPARGEAGAMNMADAFARVSGELGVCMTSTGTAAGNAAGAQAEALTAGSPVLHITTQVDLEFADRDRAAIHDVPRQPEMLRGISKAVFRMWDANGAVGTLTAAVSAALSAPTGPVSLEIPVDVQRRAAHPATRIHLPQPTTPIAPESVIDEIAELVKTAKRPLLWLGGGARGAVREATELMRRGFGVVTSTNGRAIVSEDEPASLGAFNMTPEAVELYESCDLMIVVGSRLRGNETRNNKMPLPRPLVQVDADAAQGGRNYPVEVFAHGDAADTLARLLARLPDTLDTDTNLSFDIARTRAAAEGRMRDVLGPYRILADTLAERVFSDAHPWVRDVTISNSTFGNRYVRIASPNLGVHALGGGIGQGVAMGVGAALASKGAKAITLLGDGGTMLGLAEMITAVEEQAPLVYLLMNDKAYGVIQNIQDAQYDSRRHYSALATPDFAEFCKAIGMPHRLVSDISDFSAALDEAVAASGPRLIEIDMCAIGPFKEAFAGPPAGAAGKEA
ncbi:thiamine pyrophosphate-binding protein [Nitratireductor sp. L1-7-SE]|uniref:Acetolactate synthase-1/2/3 large subunit n=3 Tax=Nitratireductor TaxID=245876 RepID=A0A1H4JDJ0_9HYPH|nr:MULTISPECIES: thiamine pyrophosphate-binding protein [Nitratireductor]MBY8917580.1 thiamine pyrophosphate-binding protein [Nitratireductor rhodophyticola]MBY8922291.1 thiamine pyrophosphate-binding protein [Nitratireductor rhodophyticola]SEB44380.1 acetolactate synthase-1/2/3 large subunit [Nitratireductor aquibiodomus]